MIIQLLPKHFRGGPCGIMAKVLDCGLKVSEFEFLTHDNIHSWTNILGKFATILW